MKRILIVIAVILTATCMYGQNQDILKEMYLEDLQNQLIKSHKQPWIEELLIDNAQAYDVFLRARSTQTVAYVIGYVSGFGMGYWIAFAAFGGYKNADSPSRRVANTMGISGLVLLPVAFIIEGQAIKLRKKAVYIYNEGILQKIERYKAGAELSFISSDTGGIGIHIRF